MTHFTAFDPLLAHPRLISDPLDPFQPISTPRLGQSSKSTADAFNALSINSFFSIDPVSSGTGSGTVPSSNDRKIDERKMPADHRHRAAFIFLSSIFLSFFSGEADGPCRRLRSRLPAGARNRIAKEQSYRIQGLFVITTQSYFLRIVDPGNDSRREQPGKANGRREGHSAARPPRVRTLPLQLQSACQSRSHVSRIVYNYAYSRGLRRGESGIAAAGRRARDRPGLPKQDRNAGDAAR